MADIAGLTINAKIEISEETVQRCLDLLRLYLQDNPDKVVVTYKVSKDDMNPCVNILDWDSYVKYYKRTEEGQIE